MIVTVAESEHWNKFNKRDIFKTNWTTRNFIMPKHIKEPGFKTIEETVFKSEEIPS